MVLLSEHSILVEMSFMIMHIDKCDELGKLGNDFITYLGKDLENGIGEVDCGKRNFMISLRTWFSNPSQECPPLPPSYVLGLTTSPPSSARICILGLTTCLSSSAMICLRLTTCPPSSAKICILKPTTCPPSSARM